MSKILLATDEDNRKSLAEMKNLRYPLLKSNLKLVSSSDESKKNTGSAMYLFLDVVKRIGRIDSEANQDDVRIRIRERTETIVILLTSSIPQGKFYVFSVDLYIGNIVFENSGDIHLE